MYLWSQARYDLHLSDSEFMSMTPRMFSYLLRRHENQCKREELMMGILAANIVNFSMCRPQHPATPADFMPSEFRKRQERTTEMTDEEMAESMNDMFNAFAKLGAVNTESGS